MELDALPDDVGDDDELEPDGDYGLLDSANEGEEEEEGVPPAVTSDEEDEEVSDADTDDGSGQAGTRWRQIKRKTVKELLIRDYTLRNASRYRLSRGQVAELNETLLAYIAFHLLSSDDIVLDEPNRIASIRHVQFMPGAYCVAVPEPTDSDLAQLVAALSVEGPTEARRPVSLASQVRKRLKKAVPAGAGCANK